MDIIIAIVHAFSWGRVLYTIVLLFLVLVFLSEIRNVWFDHRLTVGQFNYYEKGTAKPALAAHFASQVRLHHQKIKSLFRSTDEEPDPTALILNSVAPIHAKQNSLSDAEIKVQGVDFNQLLTALRRWATPPNEITGDVQNGNVVDVAVRWNGAPTLVGDYASDITTFLVSDKSDDDEAAFWVACSVVWAQAQAGGEFARVERQDFCLFIDALRTNQGITVASKGLELSVPDKKTLEDLTTKLRNLGSEIPGLNRLLADIDARLAWTKAMEVTDARIPIAGRLVYFGLEHTSAVTVAAVVKDTEGTEYLVLPDYSESAVDVFLAGISEPVARVDPMTDSQAGLLKLKDRIALARVTPGMHMGNTLPNETKISGIATVEAGSEVVLYSAQYGKNLAHVASIKDGFINTAQQITNPGDGGAPVLNDNGKLVAMGYSSSNQISNLLILEPVLKGRNLSLVLESAEND